MKKWRIIAWVVSVVIMCGATGSVVRNMLGKAEFAAWAEEKNAESLPVRDVLPEIYIKAVNPGYKNEDGISNVGEMVEIAYRDFDKNHNEKPDDMILLAGIQMRYINSSGRQIVMVEFPENSYLAGESIILRLASSPDHELAALEYKTAQYFTNGIAYADGAVELVRGDIVIDRVCWGGDGCTKAFNSANPTTLVRSEITGEFEHMSEYNPQYIPESYVVIGGANTDDGGMGGDGVVSQCEGLKLTEIMSYYAETQAEQYVELYNSTHEQIMLTGCGLKYKNKIYPLDGIVRADEYAVRWATDFSLTKNPVNVNTVEVVDVNGNVIDVVEYPNGQKKGAAWAMIGYDAEGKEIWRTTYAVTPGEANVYQEYKTCEEGKVINEATGNCVKVTTVAEKLCAEGQYLNPLSGRCKKIEEEAAAVECKEGYERNPETGRCRKIKENDGADYSLVTEVYEAENSFVALYAVIAVAVVAIVYIIYEFRQEILKLWRRVWRRFRK
ncbi:hypothetical protein IKG68_02565 [Candidatus Saccharibacteria bacterium]|nr:hypothetical protein [Candidatus Saccharibacteria bacterium]